jgi:hypothetical protein
MDRRGTMTRGTPARLRWLPAIVVAVNLATAAMLVTYSSLNRRPYVPRATSVELHGYHQSTLMLTLLLPAVGSAIYLWPILVWLRAASRILSRRGSWRPAR